MPVKDLSLEKTSHGTSFLIVFSFHLLYHAVFFINYLFLRLQEFLLMDFMLGAIGKCICVLVRSWHRLFTLQDRNSFISHIMVGELGTWAVGLYLLLVQPYRRSFVSGLMSYLLVYRIILEEWECVFEFEIFFIMASEIFCLKCRIEMVFRILDFILISVIISINNLLLWNHL